MTLRAGGAEGDRARRQVRRPRGARGHQRLHEASAAGAGRSGPDGGGARQLSARRRSRSRYVAGFAEVEVDVETGALPDPRLPGRRRRRHGDQSAQPAAARSSAARCSASATPSARSGSTTSTTACRWPSGSITTGRRRFSTRRRTCSGRRVDIPDPETPVGARGIGEPPVGAGCGAVLNAICGRGRRRDLPSRAGERRHDSDVARSGQAGARRPHGSHLGTGLGAGHWG